jgi:hypothetical protein
MTAGIRVRYLYGVCTQPEVISFLRSQCILKDEAELKAILADWRTSASAFASATSTLNFGDLPETIEVKDFPAREVKLLEKVVEDPLFQKSFSMLPQSFKIVEIDKIVAGQRYVNLDYVENLAATIPKNPDLEFLVRFCLLKKSDAPAPAELALAPNAYGFRSESTDFRFLGGYPKPLGPDDIAAAVGGGEPVAAIVLLVGYGSPQVNLFQVGNRMILNNGFHRLFALRSKGILHAPVVVQQITNVDLELPPLIAGLPSQYQVRAPRPSMMKDFLNPEFVREVRMKSRDKNVQIQWNANQVDIPR